MSFAEYVSKECRFELRKSQIELCDQLEANDGKLGSDPDFVLFGALKEMFEKYKKEVKA